MPVQLHVMSVTCHSGSTSGCLYNCVWCLLPVTMARLVDACTTAHDVCYLSQWLDLWMPVQLRVVSVTCHSGSTCGCLYNCMWCLLPVTVAWLVDACAVVVFLHNGTLFIRIDRIIAPTLCHFLDAIHAAYHRPANFMHQVLFSTSTWLTWRVPLKLMLTVW